MAIEPEIAMGIAANRTRANHRPLRPPPASCHFRVVVAGARGGVPEVKIIIELIPFTSDRLNPVWRSSPRLAAAPAVNQEFPVHVVEPVRRLAQHTIDWQSTLLARAVCQPVGADCQSL